MQAEIELTSDIKLFRLKQLVMEAYKFVAVPNPNIKLLMLPSEVVPDITASCTICGLHLYNHGYLIHPPSITTICPGDWIVFIYGRIFVIPSKLWEMITTPLDRKKRPEKSSWVIFDEPCSKET